MAHDLFQMLHEEHEQVLTIMRRLSKSESERERASELKMLRENLLPPMRGEEETVYPALMGEESEAREKALEAMEEPRAAQHALDQLYNTDPKDERFRARATALKEMLKHHIDEKEGRIFDESESTFSDKEIEKPRQRCMALEERTKASVK